MHGLPNFRAESGAGFFYHLERAGKNVIGANDLDAQALDHVGENSVNFLSLAARHARDFGAIAHDAGDTLLGILENSIRSGEDRVHFRLQLQCDARERPDRGAKLDEHRQQNRHLNYDGDGSDSYEQLKPSRHGEAPSALRDFCFALVGLFAGVYRGADGVLLPSHDFLAALDQVFCAFAQLASLLLRVIAAFFSLRGQYSRVSSPDFGAKRIPTSAPIPNPTRKKLTFEPTLSAIKHLRTVE